VDSSSFGGDASEAWSTFISKRAKNKLQQIQRSCLTFITKAYRTVSNEALSAIAGIMPIDQAMHLYKDIRAVSRGQPTNSVLTELKKIAYDVVLYNYFNDLSVF
jgi:hypothetical protein